MIENESTTRELSELLEERELKDVLGDIAKVYASIVDVALKSIFCSGKIQVRDIRLANELCRILIKITSLAYEEQTEKDGRPKYSEVHFAPMLKKS